MTEPRLPTTRPEVEAHCQATIPGWTDLDQATQARTLAYMLDLAVDLNELVDEWNQLPPDPLHGVQLPFTWTPPDDAGA